MINEWIKKFHQMSSAYFNLTKHVNIFRPSHTYSMNGNTIKEITKRALQMINYIFGTFIYWFDSDNISGRVLWSVLVKGKCRAPVGLIENESFHPVACRLWLRVRWFTIWTIYMGSNVCTRDVCVCVCGLDAGCEFCGYNRFCGSNTIIIAGDYR